MGLDLVHVLSSERHYCEFECSACKRLTSMDSYVTLKCSHPICKSCCQRHKDNSLEHCPSCRKPVGKLVELCTSQPLAFRVLQRVKVACPLRKRHNCSWAGDYKNLQTHVESHRRGQRPQDSPRKDKAAPDDTKRSQGKTLDRNNCDTNSSPRRMRRNSLEHHESKNESLRNSSEKGPNGRYLKDLPKDALKGSEDGQLLPHPSEQPDRHSPATTGDTQIHTPESSRARRRWSMEFMRLSSLEPSDAPKSTMKRRNSADMVSLSSGSMSRHSKDAENGELTALPLEVKSVQRRASLGRALSARFSIGGTKPATSGSENDNNDAGGNPAEDRPPVERRPSLTRTFSDRFSHRGNKRSLLKTMSGRFSNRENNCDAGEANTPLTNDRAAAKASNDNGSRTFRSGNYQEAIVLYTRAIEAMPEPDKDTMFVSSLYSNRGASRLRIRDYGGCINDTEEALRLDYNNVKAYLRKCWAQIELGLWNDACTTLAIGLGRIPKSTELESEMQYTKKLARTMSDVQSLERAGRFKEILEATSKLESTNKFVLVARGNAYLACNRIDKAIEAVNGIFEIDGQNVEALEIRAKARYLNARLLDALMDCQTALGIDPQRQSTEATYQRIRKVKQVCAEAERNMSKEAYRQAVNKYGMAIHAAEPLDKNTELYRMLYLGRANAHLQATNYLQALANANLVLESSPLYLKAWETKIKALEAKGRFEQLEEELGDMVQPGQWGADHEVLLEAYDRAQAELYGSEDELDYYEILGVDIDATTEEIRVAYKQKAKEWHPDRLLSAPDAERLEAEEKFKQLQEIMNVMHDEAARYRYDQGLV